MKLRDLFESDVTRDIPPVVYFHEQAPAKVAAEVGEYIITGGFPEDHPHHKRVPSGIHEQYVRLLTAIATELDKPGGPELPASWISGFYGSGKSSFAKLLGLALDGLALPDKRSVAEAWLARDTSPLARELRDAFTHLRARIDPLAVVFDIGGVARDNEHIHTAAVRMIQRRLGYCPDPHVAEMELKLERDGHWKAFEDAAAAALERPWAEARTQAMADDAFSLVMHRQFPDRYPDPMTWLASRAGTFSYAASVEESSRAIADMLRFRADKATLFIVIDEVSQYVHQDTGRMLKLQSFVSDLGQRHKGRVWLLVTGQEKLEEGGDASILGKMKDRFPEKLRVHLAVTNIRDVVHKRLLGKNAAGAAALRTLFQRHRNELRLFAYDCDAITEDDFVDVYPLLPGHIDLILQITSALRTRSSRSQGDDQAIRGLLQLLGELFRGQQLADHDLGALVTLDQVYEVQHTALDSDVQASMARVLHHCHSHDLPLAARAAKTVALLELIQERIPTDARLVAACLYDRLDRGSHQGAVTDALEELRRVGLLGYSEKHGYKIQSSSGEEWERERRDVTIAREQQAELIQDALQHLVAEPEQPKLDGRKFPWLALFSDGRRAVDVRLTDPRDPAAVTVDFRFLSAADERDPATWVNRSSESVMVNRLIWVVGDPDELDTAARELGKSAAMVKRYEPRAESLPSERRRLLFEEKGRRDELAVRLRRAVDAAWLGGTLYFRGKRTDARDHSASAAQVLSRASERVLRDLFPHFVATRVSNAEVMQLIEPQLNAPSPKFLDELGLLELENGRYVPTCSGVVPRRVLDFITAEAGVSGAGLYAHFGGPPYGYAPEVVRACVAGLLRASKVRIESEAADRITAARDAGVRDVLEKERGFKNATIFPVGDDAVDLRGRARICKMFEERLGLTLDRENDCIADAVSAQFPVQMARLRDVLEALRKLPGNRTVPQALVALEEALGRCYRLVRQTEPTVLEVLRKLDALNDGLVRLSIYVAELTPAAIDAVRKADDVARYQLDQLQRLGAVGDDLAAAGARIADQLAGETPWRDVAALSADLALVLDAYREARGRLLAHQAEATEAARQRLKRRDGFATLTADQSHHVLRPISEAPVLTDDVAVSPALDQLRDAFDRALPLAEQDANDRLDAILSEKPEQAIRKVQHSLANREIADVAELDRVLADLRARIVTELAAGAKVRLV
ncbi:MAG: BREX system P-loop protein BrxC [Myxococcales bacterium]|nr:BREX system P-loop protein BrxC [Myxococcales bacterium]